MDHRAILENLVKEFNRRNLVIFFRAANGSFRPDDLSYGHYLQTDIPIIDLRKAGQIDFSDNQRMIVVTGRSEKELTSRSGKLKQYDLAKKILKAELCDSGDFCFS